MIGFVKGTIEESGENYLVVDCSGVGFELIATSNAVSTFSGSQGQVKIPTYMSVREDAMTLFGFVDTNEKVLFTKLISVSGVGPKMAITILSSISVVDLCLAIASADTITLSKVKGLGKKTAEKIIVELREKIGKVETGQISISNMNNLSLGGQEVEDAVMALESLGLSAVDAQKLVQRVAKPDMKTEEIIRKCLKDMSR